MILEQEFPLFQDIIEQTNPLLCDHIEIPLAIVILLNDSSVGTFPESKGVLLGVRMIYGTLKVFKG